MVDRGTAVLRPPWSYSTASPVVLQYCVPRGTSVLRSPLYYSTASPFTVLRPLWHYSTVPPVVLQYCIPRGTTVLCPQPYHCIFHQLGASRSWKLLLVSVGVQKDPIENPLPLKPRGLSWMSFFASACLTPAARGPRSLFSSSLDPFLPPWLPFRHEMIKGTVSVKQPLHFVFPI